MRQTDDLVRLARDRAASVESRLAAFGELVGIFQDMTFASALAETGDFHLAEDAAQEAFLSAYLELDRLRSPETFGGWLHKIAQRKARRLTRRHGTVKAGEVEIAEELPVDLDTVRRRARVHHAVAALPVHERLPVALFYWGGYAHRQIAALLEIAPEAARKRLERGRKRLTERMEEMDAMEAEGLEDVHSSERTRFADGLKEMLEAIEPRELFRPKDPAALRRLAPVGEAVRAWEKRLEGADERALCERTEDLRRRLAEEMGNGRAEEEVLTELLPEAFGTVAWNCRRAGEPLEEEALLAAVVLHRGQVVAVEDAVGNGALAVLYLNALPGKGTHLLAADEATAVAWAQRLGPLASALGLEVGSGVGDGRGYRADIWCTGAADLIFSYLKDRMGERRLRAPHFAVLDGIEELLVEGFKTPLEVSRKVSGWDPHFFVEGLPVARELVAYQKTGSQGLIETQGYNLELTEHGVEWLAGELPEGENEEMRQARIRAIRQLARGLVLYERGRDYTMEDGRVFVVDAKGRSLKGRRFSEGLHQALEAKEGVEILPETELLAHTTYQEFLSGYPKLSGIANGFADVGTNR